MAQSSKPLPALYVVYVLRSTVRHASLYIGSTPNPPRRLKQHNGDVQGGAVRTSRHSLRPWEMIALVSGFPSMVAALKFEWALTNPHLSLHIPTESRLAISTKKKRNGMPKRPPSSLKSVMSNIHLLTGVPSFARWPLNLHFFAQEAYRTWDAWTKQSDTPAREGLKIICDFVPPPPAADGEPDPPSGINALPLDYAPMKAYVEKAQDVVLFDQEGQCVHCHGKLESDKGIHAMCPNEDCVAMGHLDCWSRHALPAGQGEDIIPDHCSCPSCGGDLRWGDMMKELSLRLRGAKEIQKLLKKKQKRAKKAVAEAS